MDTDSPKYVQVLSDLRVMQELIVKFKAMNVDATEYACLKGIILLKTGKNLRSIFLLLLNVQASFC